MSRKIHSMLILLLAALTASTLVNCKRRSKDRCGKMRKVLAASGTIKPGTPLTVEVVEEREIPEEFYSDSMLHPADLEINRRRLIVHRMEKGTPIYFFNLEGSDTDKSLGQKLRPGGRAYTIEVNEAGGGGFWMQPNDHVDVLATVPRRVDGQSEPVTITLLQNVIVLKVGARGKGINNPDNTDFTFGSVTLLVLPEEAELLHQAEVTGRLGLSLRNPDDRTLLDVDGGPRVTAQDSLFSRQRPPQSSPAVPQQPVSPATPVTPPPPASMPAGR